MTSKYSAAHTLFEQIAAICPATHSDESEVITVIWDLRQIGKRFIEQPDESVNKESVAAVYECMARTFYVPDHETFQKILELVSQSEHAAIINASFNPVAVGESCYLLSRRKLEEMRLDGEAITTFDCLPAFARLKVHARPSRWQLLDRDEDKHTPSWATSLNFDGWRTKLDNILVGVLKVKMLRAHSSSARVLKADGTPVGGGNGHVWIKAVNADNAERTQTAIMARAVEHSLSWSKPKFSKTTGEVVAHSQATIVDASVWTLGRLVFVGMPVCKGNLIIIPQRFEIIAGEQDALDTALSTFSPLKVYRITAKKGAPVRIKRSAKGFNVIVENLSLDTVLELKDGSLTTVTDLTENYTGKVRCQAPFRESESMAAFFAIDDYGRPLVFDSGTNTLHVLPKRAKVSSPDPQRVALVEEYQRWIGNLIGDNNVDAVLDTSVLEAAWDATFYEPDRSKFVLLNPDDEFISLSAKDFNSFGFVRTFGDVLYADMLDEAIDELHLSDADQKKLHDKIKEFRFTPLIQRMKLYRQAKSMDISVDMFANRGALSVTDGVASVVVPHRPFASPLVVRTETVKAVVDDYTQHFPELMDFLGLVLNARFATDRRHAFIWLHSLSSWGKGFLLAIFDELGLVVEVSASEIEKAMAGGPVGLSLADTLRSWILFVDEFKAASSELKLLNRQMSISPKHQLRCSIQLYTKLFASAENVRSLVGEGVEGQFNNRFAYLSPATRDLKLEDRPLFNELGKAMYLAALVSYVVDFLNEGVHRLCAVGRIEASKVSDKFIEQYQSERRLQATFGSLDETVVDVVSEIDFCLNSYAEWKTQCSTGDAPDAVQGIGPQLLATLKRTASIGYVSVGENSKERRWAIVLSNPAAFIKKYLSLSEDRSTIGKMQYKVDEIAEKLHQRPEPYKGKVRIYDRDGKHGGGVYLEEKRGIVIFTSHEPVERLASTPRASIPLDHRQA